MPLCIAKSLILTAMAAMAVAAPAQKLELNAGVTTCSTLEDVDDAPHGSGSVAKLSGKFDFFISRSADEAGRPIIWTGTVRTAYGHLSNHGEAAELYPDEMFDASVNVSHVRPLAGKWSMMISAGIGVYSDLDRLSGRNLLANGAAVFVYRVNRSLDVGGGIGLTNAYGVPMVLPMPFLRWATGGKFELKINMIGRASVTGAMRLNERARLNFDFLSVESMSAITRIDGKYKVFGVTSDRSAIRPEYQLGKATVHLAVGCTWRRSMRLTNRSFKDFFYSFNHKRRYTHRPALWLEAGYSIAF